MADSVNKCNLKMQVNCNLVHESGKELLLVSAIVD